MKLSKLFILASTLCACLITASCDSGSNDMKNFTFEAEYIDLDDVQGSGISSDQGGVEMIYGDGTAAQKQKGWSNGYYVGYTYSANLKLDFVFNSNLEAKATIILRLGSELGDLNLDPDTFEIHLNGNNLYYAGLSIGNSSLEDMEFFDKTVTTRAKLLNGENTLTLVVKPNTFKAGNSTGGPCVDCVKISTTADLTWNPKTDNPDRRGQI